MFSVCYKSFVLLPALQMTYALAYRANHQEISDASTAEEAAISTPTSVNSTTQSAKSSKSSDLTQMRDAYVKRYHGFPELQKMISEKYSSRPSENASIAGTYETGAEAAAETAAAASAPEDTSRPMQVDSAACAADFFAAEDEIVDFSEAPETSPKIALAKLNSDQMAHQRRIIAENREILHIGQLSGDTTLMIEQEAPGSLDALISNKILY